MFLSPRLLCWGLACICIQQSEGSAVAFGAIVTLGCRILASLHFFDETSNLYAIRICMHILFTWSVPPQVDAATLPILGSDSLSNHSAEMQYCHEKLRTLLGLFLFILMFHIS